MVAKITPVTLVSPDGRDYKVDTNLELNNLVSQGYSRKNGKRSDSAASTSDSSKSDASDKAGSPAKTEKTDPEGSQAPALSAAKSSTK